MERAKELNPSRFMIIIIIIIIIIEGMRYRSWLRHYVKIRKVAGSFHDDVIAFFNWSNPSSRTVALGSTQPLTEMSTRNLPGSKARPEDKADNLTAICEPIFWKMWEPRCLTNLSVTTTCHRDSFTLLLLLWRRWRCWWKVNVYQDTFEAIISYWPGCTSPSEPVWTGVSPPT
jgi:hypothetical protein